MKRVASTGTSNTGLVDIVTEDFEMPKAPDPKPTSRFREAARKFWDRFRGGTFPIWYVLLVVLLLLTIRGLRPNKVQEIDYSKFKTYVKNDEVAHCTIQQDVITGSVKTKPSAEDIKN